MRFWSLFFLSVAVAQGFTTTHLSSAPSPRHAQRISHVLTSFNSGKQGQTTTFSLLNIRGGGGGEKKIMSVSSLIQTKHRAMIALASTCLASGPYGVLSLWAVASSVVVPLTLYRQAYSFSVGYGYSVFAMALMLLAAFVKDPSTITSLNCNSGVLLTVTTALYGLRLGTFLLMRNTMNKQKGKEVKNYDKTPRLKRIPFAVSVALFYAFMTTPAMYALRAPPTVGSLASKIAYTGVALAVAGALLEAIADAQKFWIKQKYGGAGANTFVGPTGGVYRWCRHPNYLGEIMFWVGVCLGGAPSFGRSIQAWICSLLGLYGIVGIMRNATSRLDAKQAEKYKGQDAFELWTDKVKAPLVPFVN